MSYTTLISTQELAENLDNPNWAIIDCRFALNDTEVGRQRYLAAHIPGAIYAHLDEDLSGPIIPGKTGRHPLPDIERFAQTLSGWGIDQQTQVVAYDQMGGLFAGRLWWMLRWLGHDAVAVLDGDWRHWQKEGRSVSSGNESRAERVFQPHPQPHQQVSVDEVVAALDSPSTQLWDARSLDRYRGENESMDAKGGHIPGAISMPFAPNLAADGRFLPMEQLRQRFEAALGGASAEDTVVYCGSGVSAAHNLLAMAHVGLDGARLYAGSWSDWINDPAHPIAVGSE